MPHPFKSQMPHPHLPLCFNFTSYVWNFEHWCASGVGAPPLDTQWLSNEGQLNALTCVLIQQTSWLSWCLQIWTDRVLHPGTSGIMTGVSPISDILPQVADHECCYDLRCTSADAVHGVWTKLKSTITLYFQCITNVWSTSRLNYYGGSYAFC